MQDTVRMVDHLIGGRTLPAATGARFERIDPVSGRGASSAAAGDRADALAAAAAAEAAFPNWAHLGPNERRRRLERAADRIDAHTAGFVEDMQAELGCTAGWAHFNVALASQMLREAAALTTQIRGDVIPSDVPGSLALAMREPVGVVLGIAPWNAPVILGVRAVAMPLACGNTVVLKSSELCPATHRRIGTALEEAELGDGVINVISHARERAPEVCEALITHPAVRRINFTGSTAVGRELAVLAARELKPILLELGGKAPALVLPDADLAAAAAAISFGAFMNQGQICMSTECVLMQNEIADELASRIAERARALQVGDPREGDVALGAMATPQALERATSLLEDATARGAKLLCGGAPDPARPFIEPTVVDWVTPEMRIFHEETFAPIVALVRYDSEAEAIRLANQSEYGLSSAIFSRDSARALELARQLRTGICHINGPTVHDEAQMPFGGTKASGFGRFGGLAAIHEFTELRWITLQTQPRSYPL